MELGEAVGVAQDTGLPLLLSTEAAGELAGLVKVGRLKGRPGYSVDHRGRRRQRRTERFRSTAHSGDFAHAGRAATRSG